MTVKKFIISLVTFCLRGGSWVSSSSSLSKVAVGLIRMTQLFVLCFRWNKEGRKNQRNARSFACASETIPPECGMVLLLTRNHRNGYQRSEQIVIFFPLKKLESSPEAFLQDVLSFAFCSKYFRNCLYLELVKVELVSQSLVPQ